MAATRMIRVDQEVYAALMEIRHGLERARGRRVSIAEAAAEAVRRFGTRCDICGELRELTARDLDPGDPEVGPRPDLVSACAECWASYDAGDRCEDCDDRCSTVARRADGRMLCDHCTAPANRRA